MDEEWTDAKADRRSTLVDLKLTHGLSAEESSELKRLQEQFGNYQDKICPLPMDPQADDLSSHPS
jgi:hypothetical protein